MVLDGEPLAQVIEEIRAHPKDHDAPIPAEGTRRFRVTIADLGRFDAATYAADLERWARAAIAMSDVP